MPEMTPDEIEARIALLNKEQAAHRKEQIIRSAIAACAWVDTIDADLDAETAQALRTLYVKLGSKIQKFSQRGN